jgi:hypothetical protein
VSTLTISSGVHVGTRNDATAFITWFAASPTTQFSPFTITSAARSGVGVGGQAVLGHAGITDRPVVFEFQRRTRDVLNDSLAAVVAKDLLNGQPKTTLSGWRDAIARSGFLVNVAWSERRNAGGSTAFSVWGVLVVEDASVRGFTESMRLVLHPCDALCWLGTGKWFMSPLAYAAQTA